ncbi:hypothetical protein [Myroides sp. TSA_177.3]
MAICQLAGKNEEEKWVYDEKSVVANGNLPINWTKWKRKVLIEAY